MCRKKLLFVFLVAVVCVGLASVGQARHPDPVGWWKLDDGAGTTAVDSSGNGYDGTVGGDAAWVTGKYGGGLQFSGAGWVDLPAEIYNDVLAVDSTLTFCFFHYIEAMVNTVDFGVAGGVQREFQSHLPWGSGLIYFDIAGTTRNNVSYQAEWLGEWNHFCYVYSVGNTKQLYCNGELIIDAPEAATGTLSTSITNWAIGTNANHGQGYTGMLDDVRVYNAILTQPEIQAIVDGIAEVKGPATSPKPGNNATDVLRDVVLGWTPGEFANTHDIYLGTVFDDVNNARRTDPRGVLASQGQLATTYDPPGRLDLGQTYYWRIDEVNAPPTSTIYEGSVWSFTVEPVAYPIGASSISVTASSSNSASEGPENTINGSGLDADDLHSVVSTDMWLSGITGPQPTWIQYEFDKVYKLHHVVVWNHNTLTEPVIGFGIKAATIEYSVDGAAWVTLGTAHELARGPGVAGYAANTTVDLGGIAARYVKITANSNWGGIVNQFGLSEVRFFSIPVVAREPDPASGAADVDVDATLSWRAGREAAKHNVYLSTDEQAVIDATAPVVTVTSPSHAATMNLASTYYWRVDEVNDTETPTTWQGDIWSLSTQEYLVVDDFEAYNDIEAGQEGSNFVYDTWADGFANPATNGSTMGYTEAFQPSMEKTRFFDGKQSVPLSYNNTAASLSEVTANGADLLAGKDWSKYGIKGLTLRFYGDPNNAPQQMYAKVNGKKVLYDGDAQNLKNATWQMWYINLASLGTNLSNVSTLTIGFERIGGLGGQGMILLDGIRLYSYERQLITPAVPDTANLVGHWKFDEGAGTTATDSSTKKNNGTITGAQWVAGRVAGALKFSGAEYVQIPATAWSTIQNQVTIGLWVYGDVAAQPQAGVIFAAYQDPAVGNTRVVSSHCPYSNGNVYFDTGGTSAGYDRVNKVATAAEYEGSWQYWTFTKNAETGEQSIYLNGKLWHTGTGMIRPMTGVTAFTIGCHPGLSDYFIGMLDDFRLYNQALSPGEVAGLAGLMVPFDKPF